MLLFLELEGVLHRPGHDRPDELDGQLIANFEAVLRRYRKLEIVLASEWRLRIPHNDLMAWFHADIRARCVGRLPTTEHPGRSRGDLVAAYLERLGTPRLWAALDADAGAYVDHPEAVFLCQPSQGLDSASAEAWSTAIVQRALAWRREQRSVGV